MVRVYDKAKWHHGGTFPTGRPPSQAYVHIGMYLTWLILRDLVDESFFGRTWLGRDRLAPVKARKRTACFLQGWVDHTLADNMLTDEGAAFSDDYYGATPGYLDDWTAQFGESADDYSVPDSWETYDRIAPVLEDRYRSWLGAGRRR